MGQRGVRMTRFFVLLVAAVCALGTALHGIYHLGYTAGKTDADNTRLRGVVRAVTEASNAVQTQVKNDLDKSNQTGRQREAKRAAIDHFFNHLESESHDAKNASSSVDSSACVLPADRLSIWAAANAGANVDSSDHGVTASQLADSAADASTAGVRANGGLGVQPPHGGKGLSPNGSTTLRAADVSEGGPQ
jgi:glutamine synthetase adenylyltransferase